jgi:type IV pilus assembly protein PilQ
MTRVNIGARIAVVAALVWLPGSMASARQETPAGGNGIGETAPAHSELRIDRAALPASAHRRISALNVRGADLRDLLRGIGAEYGLNVIVDDAVTHTVTVQLTDLPVIDALLFLAEEHGLSLIQTGGVFRVRTAAPPVPAPLPAPTILVRDGLLSVDLAGQDVRDVVRALSLQSEANIVVRPGVSGPVHGMLRDVPFERGLRTVFENNGFAVRLRDGIYHIEVERRPQRVGEETDPARSRRPYWVSVSDSTVAFDVTDAPIADVLRDIAAQANLSVVSYAAPQGQITARATVASVDHAFDLLLRDTDFTYRRESGVYSIGDRSTAGIASTRLIRLGHLQASRVIEMLPEGVQTRASIRLVPEHNGLMITGSRDVINEIASVVSEIDHPTPQILIEALVVDFEGFNALELGLSFGRDPTRSGEYAGGRYSWGDGADQRGGFESRGGASDANWVLDRAMDGARRLGAGDFVQWIGRLPDDFFARIRALAAQGKAEVRSRPQIATLNGHEASLTIGTTQYFILRSSTPIASATEVFVQETERFEKIEANVTLRVLPWVGVNGEVTTEIRPEFSTPVGAFDPNVPPTINTRILESTVRLQDGETIVLGGMIQETDQTHHNKIPILGDLPVIGALFRNRQRSTRTSELVIFLTPHVFYGDERDTAKWRGIREHLGVEAPVFETRDSPRGWSGTSAGPSRTLYGPPVRDEPVAAEPVRNDVDPSDENGTDDKTSPIPR